MRLQNNQSEREHNSICLHGLVVKVKNKHEILNVLLHKILIEIEVGHGCFPLFGTVVKARFPFPMGCMGGADGLPFVFKHAMPLPDAAAELQVKIIIIMGKKNKKTLSFVSSSYIQTCFCLSCIL